MEREYCPQCGSVMKKMAEDENECSVCRFNSKYGPAAGEPQPHEYCPQCGTIMDRVDEDEFVCHECDFSSKYGPLATEDEWEDEWFEAE